MAPLPYISQLGSMSSARAARTMSSYLGLVVEPSIHFLTAGALMPVRRVMSAAMRPRFFIAKTNLSFHVFIAGFLVV